MGQEGQLDLAKVGTKIPQLESCSAKLAANPVELVSALTRDLPDHQPIVICELFQPAGSTGAWRSPPRGSRELAEGEVLNLRVEVVLSKS